ncbi:hypothetical protein F5Y15DRAFT_426357 [Xylariaceae sp. FL0016]|nr:hypothetical protein F5Y15DRAFT_426357 [Xylariaceae sp. FL0016]
MAGNEDLRSRSRHSEARSEATAQESPARGRSTRRRYEFRDSNEVTPSDPSAHQSNITTMTEFIRHGQKPSTSSSEHRLKNEILPALHSKLTSQPSNQPQSSSHQQSEPPSRLPFMPPLQSGNPQQSFAQRQQAKNFSMPSSIPASESSTQQQSSPEQHDEPESAASASQAPQAGEGIKVRLRKRPAPLNLDAAIRHGEKDPRLREIEVFRGDDRKVEISQGTARPSQRPVVGYLDVYSPSLYSDWSPMGGDSALVSPINLPRRSEMRRVNFLEQYVNWHDRNVSGSAQGPFDVQQQQFHGTIGHAEAAPRQRLGRMRSRSALGIRDEPIQGVSYSSTTGYQDQPVQGIPRSNTTGNALASPRQDTATAQQETMVPFSPLTPYTPYMPRQENVAKTKQMFGRGGWLEDTARRSPPKKTKAEPISFMESFKRKARELAESAAAFKQPGRSQKFPPRKIYISLDAREQSLLYCELELHLSNALDSYVKAQLNGGRLSADKLKKIAEGWAAKGRPRVIGFRYDLETQLDLILAHLNDFRFYGSLQTNPDGIRALLDGMKRNARYMKDRTYCNPDSVVAKHVFDAQGLLRLLGTAESIQRSLEDASRFLHAIIERENMWRRRESGLQPGDASAAGPTAAQQQARQSADERQRQLTLTQRAINDRERQLHEQRLQLRAQEEELKRLRDAERAASPSRLAEQRTRTPAARDYEPPSSRDRSEERIYRSALRESRSPIRPSQQEQEPQEQEQVQASQRQFSGPILLPATYDPERDEPAFPNKYRRD